ncbi:MAG TPA: Ig-like domain-containing protein [Saprospiraceae bacterium]|nr:Ig-like domain-containing protein [Saprospiraceae bacterium]
MPRRSFSFLPYLVSSALLLATSCATPAAPDGGPRDNRPPQIDSTRSTPNLQTNFQKQPIELTFDEWVTLNEVFQQVLISPPLEYDLDISLKRKTVVVAFDEREVLRDNATYTINFGEAIRDLTEGNPADELRFIFSTGPQLDSLRMRGNILDARTREPVEGALFMLYENTADSVVRTERPFYFGKTDSEGKFLIKNLKPGTFKGFALTDENFNYRYDLSSERIGFPDSLLTITPSAEPDVVLRLFAEAPPLQVTRQIDDVFGVIKLAFNQPPYGVQVNSLANAPDSLWLTPKEDTLLVYYDQPSEETWSLQIEQDTMIIDTIEIAAGNLTDITEPALLKVEASPSGSIHPRGQISWRFSRPIGRIDTSRMQVQPDTQAINLPFSVAIDSTDLRKLTLSSSWQAEEKYNVALFPGAVQDWHGISNDSVTYSLRTASTEDFGNIQLTVDALDSTRQYILRLMRGESIIAERIIDEQAIYQAEFPQQKPGDYMVRLIVDRNRNGRWDTGSYDQKRQPEVILDHPIERLRANWDLEVTIAFEE